MQTTPYFNFDAGNRRAFSEVCRICHLPDTDELFHAYEAVNAEMWSAFDRGECTKDFLAVERFRLFLERAGLQADPVQCNKIHLKHLSDQHRPAAPRSGGLPDSGPNPQPIYRYQCCGCRAEGPPGRQRPPALYHGRLYLGGRRGEQALRSLF